MYYDTLMQQKSHTTRPGWDTIWMDVAKTISERSPDPNYKVAAIVVSSDNTQVLALGYNGDHAGGSNQRDSDEPGESGFIHAEVNALIKLDYNNPKRKIMYVSMSPCKMCAKAIVNAGIAEVVYQDDYRDLTGITLLRNAGIRVRKINTTAMENQ